MTKTLPDKITAVLSDDKRVLFAFLYGAVAETGKGNDIDIAVYASNDADFHKLSADLKISLHKKIGLSPDVFDVRILNGLVEKGDIFGLLYLKNVLTGNRLSIDRNPGYWTVDDARLIASIREGRHDFDHFIKAIETYMFKGLDVKHEKEGMYEDEVKRNGPDDFSGTDRS